MVNSAVIIWTIDFNNTINSKTIYIMNLIYLKQLFVYQSFIGSAQIAHVTLPNVQLSPCNVIIILIPCALKLNEIFLTSWWFPRYMFGVI